MTRLRAKLAARIAALGVATLGLSACYYDAGIGLGYYDDGYSYYDNGYGCDPYSPFDSYYDCDYRGGFYNIGYGGGWYQDYWYPGYGFYIFDRGGRRYTMYDHHRRYWAGKRHEWYRNHHRRDGHDGRRGWEGRRSYQGSGDNARPDGWHRDGRREERRGDGRGERRRNWSANGSGGAQAVPPVTTPQAPARGDGRQWRRGGDGSTPHASGGNRRHWQTPSTPQTPQATAAPAPAPQPRMARPGRDQQRRAPRNIDNGNAREQ